MIFYDAEARRVISSLGWVDGPGLWTFGCEEGRIHLLPVESAKFVSLRRYDDLLRLVHHGAVVPTVSLRRLARLEEEAARLCISDGEPELRGNNDLWASVDGSMLLPRRSDTVLINFDAASRRIQTLDLSWYWQGDYDLGYQGLIDCVTLPGKEHVIVSVQRSSCLVVIGVQENRKIGEIQLAGRSGNPTLQYCGANELVTVDYDTICRVDLNSMAMVACAKLQDGTPEAVRQFVGDVTVHSQGFLVPRPFSGDVVLVDLDSLAIKGRARTGGEPLQAALISDAKVLARDWKTGRLLEGQLVAAE